MAIYVDEMRAAATIGGTRGFWSHLIADSSDELAMFASQLGLNSEWLQYPGTFREHYDVTDSVRRKAIQLGAVPVTMRDLGKILRKRVALA